MCCVWPVILLTRRIGSVPAGGVQIIRIGGIGNDLRRFEPVGGVPIAVCDLAAAAEDRRGDGAAILLRGVHEEREAVIGGDVVHLAGGLVEPGGPSAAAVHADPRALIDREDHVACR